MSIRIDEQLYKKVTSKKLSDGKNNVVRQYKDHSGLNEVKVFKHILQYDHSLLAPRYVKSSTDNLSLEVIECSRAHTIEAKHLDILENWLICKYKNYENKDFLTNAGLQIKRYNKLKMEPTRNSLNSNIVKEILDNQHVLAEFLIALSALPYTLEHGYLHENNIRIDKEGDEIQVTNWFFSSVSNGLVDILNFLHLVQEINPSLYSVKLKNIQNKLRFKDLEQLLVYEGIFYYLSELQYISPFVQTGRDFTLDGIAADKYAKNCISRLQGLWGRAV